MMRGRLTQAIKERSKELLGYEITTTELRLMAYAQYTMMNSQMLDPKHMNQDDRDVLTKWRKAGHVSGGASDFAITREFWDAMNDLLWMGYVDYDLPAESPDAK